MGFSIARPPMPPTQGAMTGGRPPVMGGRPAMALVRPRLNGLGC